MDTASLRLPSIRDFSKTWRRCWSLVLLSIAEIGSTNILVIVSSLSDFNNNEHFGFCRSDVRD